MAKELGYAILAYLKLYDKEVIESCERSITFTAPDGVVYENIPIINCSHKRASYILHTLSEGALFALGWWHRNDGQYKYSLRSSNESGFDVSKLAALYGGGGHKKAAGFLLPVPLEKA
jgi:nanoRNase/pAp phosphatase (c-di-AMP/oligoRNAs hydrolase)